LAGSALIIVVSWHWESTARTVSSVTFNGSATGVVEAKTNADTSGVTGGTAVYYILSPTATTANVVVTMSAAVDGMALSLYNVSGVGAVEDSDGDNSTVDGAKTVTLTCNAASFVVGARIKAKGESLSFTPATGVTEALDETVDVTTEQGRHFHGYAENVRGSLAFGATNTSAASSTGDSLVAAAFRR
jgi:phage shock protein PspC (stress-responsive transcriptional regulator)